MNSESSGGVKNKSWGNIASKVSYEFQNFQWIQFDPVFKKHPVSN